MLEGAIKDAAHELIAFLYSSGIPPNAVELSSLQMRMVWQPEFLTHRLDVGLMINNYQVAVPVKPNLNALLKEAYEPAMIQAFKSETLFESLGIDPSKMQPAGTAASVPYLEALKAKPETTAGKISAAQAESDKQKITSHINEMMTPKPPPPKTYLQLKQEALEKGKLANPPVSDDKDVI
jgi:hypothetical protein